MTAEHDKGSAIRMLSADTWENLTQMSACVWIAIHTGTLTRDHDIFAKGQRVGGEPSPVEAGYMFRDEVSPSGDTDTASLYFLGTTISGPSNLWIDNDYHHLGFTFDAETSDGLRLYFDGELLNTGSSVGMADTPNSSIHWRWATDRTSFATATDGSMLDGRVYTRVLSPEEMKVIYHSRGQDNIIYGLDARWLFNNDRNQFMEIFGKYPVFLEIWNGFPITTGRSDFVTYTKRVK